MREGKRGKAGRWAGATQAGAQGGGQGRHTLGFGGVSGWRGPGSGQRGAPMEGAGEDVGRRGCRGRGARGTLRPRAWENHPRLSVQGTEPWRGATRRARSSRVAEV